MNVFRENRTTISRLSVRSENADALRLKMRFERLFAAGDFLPENIPPRAIICIKKLRDPAPQTLNLQTNSLRFSDVWEKAVAREIEKLYRRAARPIGGSVPAQAEAVIFNDKSELLACLANDWCEGVLFQNWWWQSLFPNLERAQTIAKIWIESAEFVPSALKILARKRDVAEFINKLEPNEALDLTEKLIQTFALNRIYKAAFSSVTKREKENFQNAVFEKKTETFIEKTLPKKLESKAFFKSVPEINNSEFIFERKVFFAVALMLERSPRFVRTDEFAEEIRQLKIESELRQKEIISVSEKVVNEPIKLEKNFEKPTETLSDPREKKSQIFFSNEAQRVEKSDNNANRKREKISKKETTVAQQNEGFQGIKQESETQKQTRKDEPKTIFEERKQIENSETIIHRKELKNQEAKPEKTTENLSSETFQETENETVEIIIRTNYGGVFFLLNFALYLKLYRDFSEPLGEEIDLNIWDFIALLSLEFIGEKIKKDAVWKLLKKLAERASDEEFLFDFANSKEWKVPLSWLETFSKNETCFWSKTENRLVVRHSEKFNILDIELNSENRSEDELENSKDFFSEVEEAKIESFYENFSPAESWFKNFVEFAEWRLLQALDVENRRELNEILFERSATIAVSETDFEAIFSLADLPLSVRFSGLDRNPGWIPAAGKYVEFMFV